MNMDTYDFEYSDLFVYGNIRRLINQHVKPGSLVLDLGCGRAPIAEPLIADGFRYLGVELDQDSVDAVVARGVPAKQVDLRQVERTIELLNEATDGELPAAVIMIDVLEHLVETDQIVKLMRDYLAPNPDAVLVLSVPNVTHIDIAAKLLAGHFDYTPTGLLDHTHVRFFDSAHLTKALLVGDWVEVGREDHLLPETEQHAPKNFPTVANGSLLAQFLRRTAKALNPHAETHQFARVYRNDSREAELQRGEITSNVARPFFSIFVRTQGDEARIAGLDDLMLCLAAQSDTDFEVLVCVNSESKAAHGRVDSLVSRYAPSFREQVRVLHDQMATRGVPLNKAIAEARGEYFGLIDDDDYVTHDYVAAMHEGAIASPGSIVRTIAVERFGTHYESDGARIDFGRGVDGFDWVFPERFDLFEHFRFGRTPSHTIGYPLEAVRSFGWRFDEAPDRLEDWDFFMTAAMTLGVHDTLVPTSIYNRWLDSEFSTVGKAGATSLEQMRQIVLDRLEESALMLPAGYVRRLGELNFAVSNNVHENVDPAPEAQNLDSPALATPLMGRVRAVLRPRTRIKAVLKR